MARRVVTPPYTWCSHSTSVNTDTFILIILSLVPCAGPTSVSAELQFSFITPSFAMFFSLPATWPAELLNHFVSINTAGQALELANTCL